MFRHQGENRTLQHNIRIASVLSIVAGIVNVTGFLAYNQLTTNVTGHFALFINDVANLKFWRGTVYFLYIFSFLFGSFFPWNIDPWYQAKLRRSPCLGMCFFFLLKYCPPASGEA